MSTDLPYTPPATSASRMLAGAVLGVAALFLAAWLTENVLINVAAVCALIGLLLQSGLRRRKPGAWIIWLTCAAALAALGYRGNGRLAVDVLPVVLNAAFCSVFASSLVRGATPLIARLIEAIEGRARLTLPRVAGYARALTWTWAILLGAQAVLLAWLATLDLGTSVHAGLSDSSWLWYLHFGGFALVPAFLIVEYAFRRWWLRHIPHAPLPQFLVQLARSWPALVRNVAFDTARNER
ncbi:MAG: hypothetical protein ABI082_07765 [Dokdonella sp.]